MTKEEFELQYVKNSGVTVEWLREHGRVAKPCDCGDPSCQGWQMARSEEVLERDIHQLQGIVSRNALRKYK